MKSALPGALIGALWGLLVGGFTAYAAHARGSLAGAVIGFILHFIPCTIAGGGAALLRIRTTVFDGLVWAPIVGIAVGLGWVILYRIPINSLRWEGIHLSWGQAVDGAFFSAFAAVFGVLIVLKRSGR